MGLASGYVKIAIEAMAILQWIYPLKMVIFHSYVSLPEGNDYDDDDDGYQWLYNGYVMVI